MTCPKCKQAAEFKGYRPKTAESLLGTIHFRRGYYHCGRCGLGLFPFDDETGLMLDLDRRRPFDAQHQGRWLLALRVTRPLEANRFSMRCDIVTDDVRPMCDDLA